MLIFPDLITHVFVALQQPHSVSVIQERRPGEARIQLVRCNEPQRIYELLAKNGIRCDKVWNDTMSLSTTAPCIALIEQGMPVIYATDISDKPIGFSALSGTNNVFYHNMKHIKIRTRRHTMKRKPYLIPMNSRDDLLPKKCITSGEIAAEAEEALGVTEETKATVLYYSDPLSTAKDVIIADGRFLKSCKITRLGTVADDDDCDLGAKYICEFEPDQLCIEGKWCLCDITPLFTYDTEFSLVVIMLYVPAGAPAISEL